MANRSTPYALHVRLGADLRDRLAAYMEASGLPSASEATRVLLDKALSEDGGAKNFDRRAYREGINRAVGEFKKAISGPISNLLKGVG